MAGCEDKRGSDPAPSSSVPTAAPIPISAGDPGASKDWTVRDIRGMAPEVTVRVHDPYEDKVLAFTAVPAVPVLDRILGDRWRTAGEVEFLCRDGYRASVPSSRFQKHQAFFALGRGGRHPFTLDKPVGGTPVTTDLRPLYLVWANLDDSVVRAEADFGWPYQIVGITAVDVSAKYDRIAPPEGAGAEAERGFVAFRRWCARCHALDGVGGTVGPELNQPVSVTTYLRPEWLHRWIVDPLSVRRGTPMPGLPKDIPDRERTARDIVAYLGAVAPAEDPTPK
ncbi:MAG: cytochrome c [Myxococcales bacterium]|nr:cytochrome c [Myxococcales bacterium]